MADMHFRRARIDAFNDEWTQVHRPPTTKRDFMVVRPYLDWVRCAAEASHTSTTELLNRAVGYGTIALMARKHGLQPIIENQSGAPGEIPLVRTGTSEADTVSFRVALAQAIDLGLQWAEKDQGVSPDETLRYGIQVLGAVAMHGPAAQLYVAESSSRQHVFTSPIPHIHRAPPFPEG